jgi:hypothetical protein
MRGEEHIPTPANHVRVTYGAMREENYYGKKPQTGETGQKLLNHQALKHHPSNKRILEAVDDAKKKVLNAGEKAKDGEGIVGIRVV